MCVGIIKINNCIPERNGSSRYNYDIEVINMKPLRPQVDSYFIQENDILNEVKELVKECDVVDVTAEVKTGIAGGYLGLMGSEYEAKHPYITFYANGNILLWFDSENKLDISQKNVQEINDIIRRTILEMQS